jgi:hypothetical protein
MPWNPWIETFDENTSDEEIKQLYDHARNSVTKIIPEMVILTSTTPKIAGRLHDLCNSIDFNESGLTDREKEISALIVSVFNGCVN